MYGAIIFFQELLSESILLKQVLLEQILLRQILPEYVGTDASEQMWREVREKMELEIKDVIHTYPNKKTALNRISLTLTPGIYGLLGPNGAGKSTLMKIITGNMQPSSGKVLFNGSDIKELGRAYRDRLGYMPQQQGLYNQFTGRRCFIPPEYPPIFRSATSVRFICSSRLSILYFASRCDKPFSVAMYHKKRRPVN